MAKRKEHRILERNDDLGYPIFIAQNTRDELLAFLRTSGPPSVILCDANRHVRAIADGIARATGDTPVSQFALGESRKRLSTVERVLDAMAAAGVERGPAMRCQAGEAVGVELARLDHDPVPGLMREQAVMAGKCASQVAHTHA